MRILIVEDERVAARRLERMVKEILGNRVTSIQSRESFDRSETFLNGNEIDLLFLDLNLNGKNGFDLLTRVTASSFHTIVVSANTDGALKAFEYGVLDFVPKPFSKERLGRALRRLERRTAPQDWDATVKHLAVKKYGEMEMVSVDDVIFFKGAGDYVEIHLRNDGVELHNKSLESLEKLLPHHFVRVHKSYLVDLREVEKIIVHGGGKYELALKGGGDIPLSRTKYKDIQELLLNT